METPELTWKDVAISIRAVPGQREGCLSGLCGQLDGFGLDFSISYHRPGRTVPESYADALATTGGRSWVLQLEDDAILCRGFPTQAIRLLNSGRSLPLVSLYSGRRTGVLPLVPALEVLPGSRFLMAQGFFLRSDCVPDHNAFMLDFCRDRPFATDTATAAWMQARKLRFGRAWPSLVQHTPGPSLSHHAPHPNRFARYFYDPDC